MARLVVIGIGGTGTVCTEAIVHLAAFGYFPPDTVILPYLVDGDAAHPRAAALGRFIGVYRDLRQRRGASALQASGLLGIDIAPLRLDNPAAQAQSLHGLFELGLHPVSASIARLFFTDDEIGGPTDRIYANGFYGRTNAGACFFSDPRVRKSLRENLKEDLAVPGTKVMVIGSCFGGTGASGILSITGQLKDWAPKNAKPKIAVCQMEPYFEPTFAGSGGKGLLPDPSRFKAKASTTYQYLADLAGNSQLPLDHFFILGEPTWVKFEPEWFRADSQDNPRLWLEFAAAQAARAFAADGLPDKDRVLLRNLPVKPFGDPLDGPVRSLLHEAAAFWKISTGFVEPLLKEAVDSGRLPGHGWIDHLCEKTRPKDGEQQPRKLCEALLRDFADARGLAQDLITSCGLHDRPVKDDKKTAMTRDSFPVNFLPASVTTLATDSLVGAFSPRAAFRDFDNADGKDARLAPRPLAKWVARTLREDKSGESGSRGLQSFVQPTDAAEGDGQVSLRLVEKGRSFGPAHTNLSDADSFRDVAKAKKWGLSAAPRAPGDIPSIWAQAIAFGEALSGAGPAQQESRWLLLGLLHELTVPPAGGGNPPIWTFDATSQANANHALQAALRETNPLGEHYPGLVAPSGTVLVIVRNQANLAAPKPSDALGFVWPETIVVPARTIDTAARDILLARGRDLAASDFGPQLASHIDRNGFLRQLKDCGLPDANKVKLIDTLRGLAGPSHRTFSFRDGGPYQPAWPKWLRSVV